MLNSSSGHNPHLLCKNKWMIITMVYQLLLFIILLTMGKIKHISKFKIRTSKKMRDQHSTHLSGRVNCKLVSL